jgi:hypothetical protein
MEGIDVGVVAERCFVIWEAFGTNRGTYVQGRATECVTEVKKLSVVVTETVIARGESC